MKLIVEKENNMKSLEIVYEALTGVDINIQKQLWDERGKGYYGEYLLFCDLYKNVSGFCKILMNLNVPVTTEKTTEIDLMMIHESGIYIFEVKHYKGTIYGNVNDRKWTQYFRTAPNSVFNSPVKQNQYHINAIKNKYPDIPVYSFIVFTNDECELKVTNDSLKDISICTLLDLKKILYDSTSKRKQVLDISKIDEIFNEIKEYSPMLNAIVAVDDVPLPFYQYLDEIRNNYQNNVKENKIKMKEVYKKAVLFGIGCILCTTLFCINYKSNCDYIINNVSQKYELLEKKFEHVVLYNTYGIEFKENLISINDLILENSADIENSVKFSCVLVWNNNITDYGISIGEDTVIVVISKDGSVKEYKVFNDIYTFTSKYKIGKFYNKEGKIRIHELQGLEISNIKYIKLSNIDLWYNNNGNRKNITEKFEIEIYNTENK